jgi:hypothetical protein
MSTSTKRLSLAAVAVLFYFALLLVVWAGQPLDDFVPVGTDWAPTVAVPPGSQHLVSQRVICNTLFASDPRPEEPLPVLTPQPPGHFALEYQREPCALVHSNARLVFLISLLTVIIALALIVTLAIRTRRVERQPSPIGALPVATLSG